MYQRFLIGQIDCISVSDGRLPSQVSNLFAQAQPSDLAKHGITGSHIEVGLNCLLIWQPPHWLLIDTGMGQGIIDTAGYLLSALAEAQIDLLAISHVILSHAHLDHIGGALNQDGERTFPNARYVLSQIEWDYWQGDNCLNNPVGRERITHIRAILNKLKPDLVSPNVTFSPNIKCISVPGHTPGQMAVQITSDSEKLLYTADVIAHPLHLTETHWQIALDTDPRESLAQRRLLFQERQSLFVYHFPFPGLSLIESTHDHI